MNNPSPDNSVPDQPAASFPFRWSYIILPLISAVLTILLTAVFYSQLPDDVMYRLQDDPTAVVSRSLLAVWLIVPQLLFTFAAFVSAKLVLATTKYATGDSSIILKTLPLVGNMPAIIQFVILFAALQIFLYNAYEMQTGQLWVPAVVIVVLGGIILIIRLARLYGQARRQKAKSSRE